MPIYSSSFRIKTQGFNDVHDITPRVDEIIKSSKLSNGMALVFVPGSTAGITTIEFESGVINDLKNALERLVPQSIHYEHDARWGDGNGFAHVRASIIGASLAIPFNEGKLQLGTWQQIILIDFDNRSRSREIKVQLVGE